MKIIQSRLKNRVWGDENGLFRKTKCTTLISMKRRTRRARQPEKGKKVKK